MWVSTISPTATGLARWDRRPDACSNLSRRARAVVAQGRLGGAFVWRRSRGQRLDWFRPVSWSATTTGGFTVFTASDGLPPGAIRDIHVDRSGRLWLASAQGGLVRVDDAGRERPTFVSYTTAQGLSSNNIEVITEDRYGHIYVGGGHGLDRLDPATGRVKHFTTADGLAPGLFRAAFRDRNGVLWFGMTSGLARLDAMPEKTAGAAAGVDQRVARQGSTAARLGIRGAARCRSLISRRTRTSCRLTSSALASGPVTCCATSTDSMGPMRIGARSSEQRTCHVREPCAGPLHVSRPGGELRRGRERSARGRRLHDPASVWQRWWFLTLVALAIGLDGLRAVPLSRRAPAGDGQHAHAHRDRPARRHRRQPDAHRAAQRGRQAGAPEARTDRSRPSRASRASRSAR